MKKIIVLLAIFFYASTLFAAYDVKIAVYENVKLLRTKISKIKRTKYRKKVIVTKKGNLYYAHAILDSSKEARDAVHVYKREFKDAFIAKKKVNVKNQKQSKKTEKIQTPFDLKKQKKIKKIEKIQKILDSKKQEKIKKTEKIQERYKALLSEKIVYLCYEDGPAHLKERVVQMKFNKDTINYNSLDQESTLDIAYRIEKNKVLLTLMDIDIVHKIVQYKEEYLAVESYVGDKKMHTLRYYFDKQLAFEVCKRN